MLAVCALALSGACSTRSAAQAAPECTVHQFQACDAACGRGVRFCDEASQRWSSCTCVVLDAGFDAATDAPDDAAADSD